MHSKNTTSSDQSVNDYSESRYAEFDEYMASLDMKRQKEASKGSGDQVINSERQDGDR